ncbi:type II toxin-antitoxin system Phd/YefM family antitoxin [Pseudonocardia nigra]|uniref:type II toxin-antitoxin system Phd/YefM family antitoxin n=1 Tax=Pseudonocardia nigra TaxID=1921578 RepID=UPI001C5F1CB6|nr:type II toxin-antitoxin system Phd/YefM family antitoxin [Pseudonocardia nigra]
MSEFGVHEAKTHFSKLLEKALAGEDVIITRSGEPLVKLVPVQRKRKPNFGFAAGTFTIPDDFDEWPEEFLDYFR